MISFTSFPLQPNDTYNGSRQHHPEVAEDTLMDIDDDQELEAGGSKLTYPGESLTSSQAYMRWVEIISFPLSTSLIYGRQRPRNICG